jgi:acyl-CoA synthetase (AMP-forming)/AMP-acid ligase II
LKDFYIEKIDDGLEYTEGESQRVKYNSVQNATHNPKDRYPPNRSLDRPLRPQRKALPRFPRYVNLLPFPPTHPLNSPKSNHNPVIYKNPYTSRHYTYSTLKRTTQSFGSGLRSKWSWSKGDVLAIFSPNCIDTPAITWGCHWAGGVVSPANPAYNVRELAHHLRDSGTKALFTQKHLLVVAVKACAEVGIGRERIILIGDEKDTSGEFMHFEELLENKVEGERENLDPETDLAFLVYSSGTTGLPKGVMLSHRNVVSDLFMVDSNEGAILNWRDDRVLSVLPYYHIYGMCSFLDGGGAVSC